MFGLECLYAAAFSLHVLVVPKSLDTIRVNLLIPNPLALRSEADAASLQRFLPRISQPSNNRYCLRYIYQMYSIYICWGVPQTGFGVRSKLRKRRACTPGHRVSCHVFENLTKLSFHVFWGLTRLSFHVVLGLDKALFPRGFGA